MSNTSTSYVEDVVRSVLPTVCVVLFYLVHKRYLDIRNLNPENLEKFPKTRIARVVYRADYCTLVS